ncbi:MAG: phytanoyl-CoA dioxygenase family protein [Candidatus Latescibacteria bacterium]|nr:phytanoyl-CoA dioxygenase family protein [Candidatus Latescibacterota bacterium]
MSVLTREQIDFFRENGFIRLEQVYPPDELRQMSEELDYIIQTFATWAAAWRGPWRKHYVKDEEEDRKATLVAIHEMQHYSAAWTRAVTKPDLADAVAALMDTDTLEVHHSTLHAKPPDVGAPFPMHQDVPFYEHSDGRYMDALVHLDDADERSGCIKFLKGSYRLGPLKHILGPDTAPHLPTDQYRLDDAVFVPAKAGDVVLFHLWTIHGSAVNHSGLWRRLVRVGFRDPRNQQVAGQGLGRPGILVKGVRPKVEGMEVNVYGNWIPQKKA